MNILMLIQTGIFGLSGTMGMYAAGVAVTAVLSYLVGSLNFCRFFGKKHECKSDLYELNEKAGLSGVAVPLLLDFLCGIVCATIGLFAMPGSGFACFAALFCILGPPFQIKRLCRRMCCLCRSNADCGSSDGSHIIYACSASVFCYKVFYSICSAVHPGLSSFVRKIPAMGI